MQVDQTLGDEDLEGLRESSIGGRMRHGEGTEDW